jgi:hypothetical protein
MGKQLAMLRALVIQDTDGKFRDIGDVLKVARALGQQAFRTHRNVKVKRILGPFPECGYIAVVEGPDRTENPGVRVRKKR